ncbi:DUF4430 domain-containing protein [Eubacteriales bacterium mix99]
MRRRIVRTLTSVLLAGMMLFAAGCDFSTNSGKAAKWDQQAGTFSTKHEKNGDALKEKNELPGDGIITKAQMKTIAGRDGSYEFYSEDPDTGITYTWTYEGEKIQNPIEQKMKVRFPEEKTEKVKESANHATVGLGVALEKANLAAPAKLTLSLPEKLDADSVVLCKLVDKKPAKMCGVSIGTDTKEGKEITTLSFPVLEMGDTYYLVGGKTKADEVDEVASGEAVSNQADPGKASSGEKGTPAENSGSGQRAAKVTEDTSPGVGSTQGPEKTAKGSVDIRDRTAGNGKSDQSNKDDGNAGNAQKDRTEKTAHTCTISIDCLTISANSGKLNSSKKGFVPKNGWILSSKTVEYTPGETVYDVLYRVCRERGIQTEASYTPAYSSYYVEGIHQLYEFDVGDLSGWMYSVNGWFPNYGCSKYEVSDGDTIAWRYTCDLGRDVGDQYWENGQ